MALPKIPDHVRIVGIRHIGIKHKSRAHALLYACRTIAGKLEQYVLREPQADGSEIVAEKRGPFSVATIYTPDVMPWRKKPDEPGQAGSLVLVIGSELVGYHVAQISFDGTVVLEKEFEQMQDVFELLPRSPIAEPLFSTKKTLGYDDPAIIGLNTMFPDGYEPQCSIPNPHCPLAPNSGTIECLYSDQEVYEPVGRPRQAAVFRFHRRQYCNRRSGSYSYFTDKRDFSQLTENSGPGYCGIYVSLRGGEEQKIYQNTLLINSLVFEKRFTCSASWADISERDWDDIISGDEMTFEMFITPVGMMKLNADYSTIETGDYLDGNVKFRDDTGEPWFVTWEDPLLDLFLRQDLRYGVYAKNIPLVGLSARVLNMPLKMGYLESNAPDMATPDAAHKFFFAEKYLNASVQIHLDSFLEGTFDKMGTVGTYTLTDVRHVTRSAAAVLFSGEDLAKTAERNERFRLAVESFVRRTRGKQLLAGVEINPNISLAGNIFGYITDGDRGSLDNEAEVFMEINRVRLTRGLSRLTLDSELCFAAKMHAIDCARNDLESHTGSDGSSPADRMKRTGYFPNRFLLVCEVGENVAFGQASAHEAMLAWASSPPHWANIINPAWQDTGVAVWPGKNGQLYWVQVFGRRD